MNAGHARENAAVTKQAAIELLRENGAVAAAAIRAFTDADLAGAATVSLYADAPLTCQFMLEDHAVRHCYHHLAKIRGALKAVGRQWWLQRSRTWRRVLRPALLIHRIRTVGEDLGVVALRPDCPAQGAARRAARLEVLHDAGEVEDRPPAQIAARPRVVVDAVDAGEHRPAAGRIHGRVAPARRRPTTAGASVRSPARSAGVNGVVALTM